MTSAIFLPLSPASNFPFLTCTPAPLFRYFSTLEDIVDIDRGLLRCIEDAAEDGDRISRKI